MIEFTWAELVLLSWAVIATVVAIELRKRTLPTMKDKRGVRA